MFDFFRRKRRDIRLKAIDAFWLMMERNKHQILTMVWKLEAYMCKRGVGSLEDIKKWEALTFSLLGMTVRTSEYTGETDVSWNKEVGTILLEE